MSFAKQSFAPTWVPKLELGNQKKMIKGLLLFMGVYPNIIIFPCFCRGGFKTRP
jgi:hypothetical protein